MNFELQPTLQGQRLQLRPLAEKDFEELFAAAADPLIWEQHPQKDRYKKDVFQGYFKSAMESKGALAILDLATGKIIGISRYYNFDAVKNQIVIGYTFITRPFWGGKYNGELKALMLQHAFQFVETVTFEIGKDNLRSQKAVQKIGAVFLAKDELDGRAHVIYGIRRESFFQSLL